ncbi:MAG: BLUF domain-containing protein [Pseudomonadota bacterium]
MHLYHLVYFSKRKLIAEDEFAAVLKSSRRNNAALGITGALFMSDEYFFQVLEGPRTALSSLLGLIMNDDRHEDVVLTLFDAVSRRTFGEWSMAELPSQDPRMQALFEYYASQSDGPAGLSGGAIWDMVEAMADAVMQRGNAQKLM